MRSSTVSPGAPCSTHSGVIEMAAKSEQDLREIAECAAGPMAFFPHDSDAADDGACRKLLRRRGFEGYGRYWRICELLAGAKGHVLPVSEEDDLMNLAEELRFVDGPFSDLQALEGCKRFIEDLVDLGLLRLTEDGGVASGRMDRNANYFGTKRWGGRKGGSKRKGKGDEYAELKQEESRA